MTSKDSFQRYVKPLVFDQNKHIKKFLTRKHIVVLVLVLMVNFNCVSVNVDKKTDNSSVEANLIRMNSETNIKKSFSNEKSISIYNSSISPPKIENSIFFVSEEYGRIKEDYLQQNNVSITNHEEKALFSIIETNLTSLQYDKKATGENQPNNNFFVRSADGLLGPKRLEGHVELDNTNKIEGTASTKFSVTTNNSLNWYSDFQLPGWNDDDIPSPFNHNSYIEGSFQFNASQNLLDHQYGFNNWLRLNFENDSYGINIIFNRSSGLIENNSAFYRKPNQDFIINIVLGSNNSNSAVSTWEEGKWTQFRINLTEILNTIFPLSSFQRLEAEKVFSNLSLAFFDIQSFAFENGNLEFRLDNLHWETKLSETEKAVWEKKNTLLVDKQGNLLENSSALGLENLSSLEYHSQWKIWMKDIDMILRSPASFAPFTPVWEFKKETYYYYNQSWNDRVKSLETFQLDLEYDIDSTGIFVKTGNSSTQFISQPFILLNFLKYPNKSELLDTGINFSLLKFNKIFEQNVLEILTESNFWEKIEYNSKTLFVKLQNVFLNSSMYPRIMNDVTSTYSWKLNTQQIFSNPQFQNNISYSDIFDILLDEFPQVKESITIPNLLLEGQSPIMKVFDSGIQLELNIYIKSTVNSFEFVSEIDTTTTTSILSHSIALNEKTVIFLPWITRPTTNDQITIKLSLMIQDVGIGWIEYVFLFNLPSNSSGSTQDTITNYSSTTKTQPANTSNTLNNSNYKNSIINNPNSIFKSESSNIAIYGLMVIGPILGTIFYLKRRQQNKIYDLIYDE